MKVIWHGSVEHRDWLMPQADLLAETAFDVTDLDSNTVLVVQSSHGGAFSCNTGLAWLQRFRRQTRSTSPALVYSFELRETLAAQCSMLIPGTPGIGFLRLPFTPEDLWRALRSLSPMQENQLRHVLRLHSGLQEESRYLAHELVDLLLRWETMESKARELVAKWQELIYQCAPETIPLVEELDRLIAGMPETHNAVKGHVDVLQAVICGIPDDSVKAFSDEQAEVHRLPPKGFGSILIGDDTGYEASTIERLRNEHGYNVSVAQDLPTAEVRLRRDDYPVVLADLNFPTIKEGKALQRVALEHSKLVIAVSKALANAEDILSEVVDNCGGSRFDDPERIHSLIWQRARALGVTEPEDLVDCLSQAILWKQLFVLTTTVRGRVADWQGLSEDVLWAYRRAEKLCAGSAIVEERSAAASLLTTLRPLVGLTELSHETIQQLDTSIQSILHMAKSLPNRVNEESLYNTLHNSICQHINGACKGVSNLADMATRIIEGLKRSGSASAEISAASIADSLDQCRSELDLQRLQKFEQELQSALCALPPHTEPTGSSPLINIMHTSHFRVVAVDDQSRWRDFVAQALSVVRQTLGHTCVVQEEIFDNAQDVLEAVKQPRMPADQASDAPNAAVTTIVVCDLGIPPTRVDAEAIGRGDRSPSRENGRRLLQDLRSYSVNVPVIVLTAPTESLQDQIEVCAAGVADCDYVLKGADTNDVEELVQALLRIMERRRAHCIDLGSPDSNSVLIDDIPIPLEQMQFRTFYALCELSRTYQRANRAFTTDTILDRLDDIYGGYIPDESTEEDIARLTAERREYWDGICSGMDYFNAARLWRASKQNARKQPKKSLAEFRGNYRLWRWAIQMLDNFRHIHCGEKPWNTHANISSQQLDSELLARGLDTIFSISIAGNVGYDPANIERHVYEIRESVHSAFKRFGHFVEPREEILIRRLTEDEDHGYRVLGQIMLSDRNEEPDAKRDTRRPSLVQNAEVLCRILAVENEPEKLERIRLLLEMAGFSVRTATNAEDAVSEGVISDCPDILSLDLHIPATSREHEQDSRSGHVSNGLKVLKRLSEQLPRLHVMIATTHADTDSLRAKAIKLGVPLANFVPKEDSVAGASWEGHLLLTANRLRQQVLYKTLLPPVPSNRYPIIQVQPGTDLSASALSLVVNGRNVTMRGNQAKFLGLLLRHYGEEVSTAELDDFVYGKPVGANTRKQLLKVIRDKIRTDWLGLSELSSDRPELDILEAVSGGLVLHAQVEYL